MQEKNRCFRRSHLSEDKFRVIIRSLALDFPASKIAELSDVSRPTINKLLLKLRIRVAQVCDASSPFSGEVEVDESYFARRVRGKKGYRLLHDPSSHGHGAHTKTGFIDFNLAREGR